MGHSVVTDLHKYGSLLAVLTEKQRSFTVTFRLRFANDVVTVERV
jgi:hypothetical protein